MQKYNEPKRRNQGVSNIMKTFTRELVSSRMQELINNCGTWMQFITNFDEDRHRLVAANFCKWRFCPLCAMRKARRDAFRIATCMSYITQEHQKEFIMLTLTAPNVSGDDLPDEISRFNKAFAKLTKRDEFIKMNHGYIRKLEITYNHKKRTFHPHFHLLIAVNRGYFSGGRYIKQERWLDIWRDVMGENSITQVDVRKVKRKDPDNMADGGIEYEIAAYAAKDSDLLDSQEVFEFFYNALKGRQVLTYNGLFAKANKMFKKGELDDYKKVDDTIYYWQVFYSWNGEKYKEDKRERLTEIDMMFLANQGIDSDYEVWEG